jgi:hypothetical protein
VALGLYVWLSYRCFTAKGEESVPIFGAIRAGSSDRAGGIFLRALVPAKLGQWLRTIRVIWPECPARIALDGRYLIVRRHSYSEGYHRKRLPTTSPNGFVWDTAFGYFNGLGIRSE